MGPAKQDSNGLENLFTESWLGNGLILKAEKTWENLRHRLLAIWKSGLSESSRHPVINSCSFGLWKLGASKMLLAVSKLRRTKASSYLRR